MIRVYEAPKAFLETFKNISKVEVKDSNEKRPMGAVVPPLGLSNKAVLKEEKVGKLNFQVETPQQFLFFQYIYKWILFQKNISNIR